jgi:hypothetical protein
MTVDVARRPRRRSPRPSADAEPTIAPANAFAIGELEQTVFDCPSCARPLALGARRCPGCRVRLINGVTLGKASSFTAVGLAIGLLAGGGGGLLYGLANPAAAAGPALAAGSSSAPVGSTGGTSSSNPGATATPTTSAAASAPTPSAPAATEPGGLPPVTRSALVQVIGTNARLATAGTALRGALAAPKFDVSGVAQILRSISADSVFGQQLGARVSAWPGASDVGAEIGTFYGAIHDAAADGLSASVQNGAAYRAAATRMLKLLDGMTALDAAIHAVPGAP